MSELTQDLMDGQELAATAPVRPEAPTFAELGARQETVDALAAAGITRAFAIQEYAIPIAMRGIDMIGQAPTGTGKTLGFGVPLLERVFAPGEGSDGVPQALVVVPTRELGIQVAKDLAAAGGPGACACCRSTAVSRTSRRSTRCARAWRSWSAPPAA